MVRVAMLILGLVALDSGLNLVGSPFSFSALYASLSTANPTAASASGEFAVQVTEDGYSPVLLHMPANRPVKMVWVTENTQTCARSVVVPGLDYHEILPPTGRVE